MNAITKPATAIVEFSPFERDLAEYRARYLGVVYDLTDTSQEKQARADRLAIGKTVAELDRVHKAVKEPLKAQVDLLDGERKRIKDDLLALQDGIKQQIAAHDAALQALEDELASRVEEIKALARFDAPPSSAEILRRLPLADGLVLEGYQHHTDNADMARKSVIATLQQLLVDTQQREAQETELATLRAVLAAKEAEEAARVAAEQQAARDAQIAAAAQVEAERAMAERERVAQQAVEHAEAAARKAEADSLEALQRARAEAERALQEQQQAERKAALERQASREHAATIHRAAASALLANAGITMEQAKHVVSAIARGEVPHITITY